MQLHLEEIFLTVFIGIVQVGHLNQKLFKINYKKKIIHGQFIGWTGVKLWESPQ